MTKNQYLQAFIKAAYSRGTANIAKGCIEAHVRAYRKGIENIKR